MTDRTTEEEEDIEQSGNNSTSWREMTMNKAFDAWIEDMKEGMILIDGLMKN